MHIYIFTHAVYRKHIFHIHIFLLAEEQEICTNATLRPWYNQSLQMI